MTISPWLIYWADMADSVNALIGWMIALTCSVALVMCCINLFKYVDDNEPIFLWGYFKTILPIFIFLCLLQTIIPSTATVYKMFIIPTIVNSTIVQKLPDELQQFIDKELHDDKGTK